MKTALLKIAAVLIMVTAVNKTFAANCSNNEYTELTWIRNFYKIEAHGNVKLHLLTGDKNKVEMNSTYYNHNALVQVENGVLRITCYKTERLDVWITVTDLRALSAYDNVLVQTEGRFSVLEFDVELFNSAKADLDLNCVSTDIKLNDRSMANLSGTAMESELAGNYAATINSVNFTADKMSTKRFAPIWETRIEFAGFQDIPQSGDVTAVKQVRLSTAATKQIKFDIPVGVECINVTQSLIN